jgi:hypothetical protein
MIVSYSHTPHPPTPKVNRDTIVKELKRTTGHAGKASGALAAMSRTPEETAAREARLTQEREAQARAEAERRAWWARVLEGGAVLVPETTKLTPHGARCCLEAMKLPAMRNTICFASSWDGKTIYSHCIADDAILKEYESVHGGPRIGEPGATREILTYDAFLQKLQSDSVHQSNTLAGKVRDWLHIPALHREM